MKVEVLGSEKGLPTLQVEQQGKNILIHSKYDPVREAMQIIERHKEEIENHHHILFYGVGLGYHVQAFIKQYPEKLVSTYEPIGEVAVACASMTEQTAFDQSQLRYLFVEESPTDIEKYLHDFSNHLTQKVLLIILPSYERLLKEKVLQFIANFKEIVEEKIQNRGTNHFFSKRWTINALMNLSSTFEYPNFLLEHAETFRDKTVLLVSAGPSLSEEMDNLRKIKEQGLAYIFAVGSANKALIERGIYPDAVFTYDPQAHNHKVFQPIIDERITSIPMIYGTSVGFETVQHYPGPKLHFVTTQDTITQNFHETKLPVINDAYSIAIVTMEILYRLQVESIILVGQNFAFKNNLFYSQEIKRYDKDKREVSDASVQKKDIEDAFHIKDVYGNEILTNKGFDNMRKSMVRYIAENPQIPVINTTHGGAVIEGTTFVPLVQVMNEQLTERIVEENWYTQGEVRSVTSETQKKVSKLQKSVASYRGQDMALFAHFKEIEHSIASLNLNQLQKRFEKTDKLVRKLTSNMMYVLAICPIIRNELEVLQAEVELLRKLEISKEKLMVIVNLFASYFNRCRVIYNEVAPIVKSEVLSKLLRSNDKKEYIASCGVFQYEGEWYKDHSPIEQMPSNLTEDEKYEWRKKIKMIDRIELPVVGVKTKQQHDSFVFRFNGNSIALYGTNYSEESLKLQIKIDNRITNITIKDKIDEKLFKVNGRQLLFQTNTLKDEIHDIKIEVISNNPNFLFEAIEVDQTARAYHIHEVGAIDELIIGKRIRCHYEAIYNMVGEFCKLGEETGSFLPVEAVAEPNGDFYFIMVDTWENSKLLIADRNVQNNISYDSLTKSREMLLVGEINCNTNVENRFNYIGKKNEESEWEKYIRDDLTWNWLNIYSWVLDDDCQLIKGEDDMAIAIGLIERNHLIKAPNRNKYKKCGFRPKIILKL
ncbi:hypothetical protein CSV69_14765 [Sporosarcina sp. P26b]|uniref:motility associated factor glycosyltransferase family protein n=1 Tax=Sporosarcina sp. P26b TaxID=2048253 RepID=UPI000C16FF8F|nr:6-hydroxymethylpterin diphosphokinase MptE-like protein [Sporosarcina sp. P26b]PIC94802.1 hypothetical protein CSV69_14765 [Sporosarcina sp. P26b]